MDSRRRANLLSRSFNSLLTFYLRLSKSSLSLALFYWWSLVFAVNLFSKSLTMDSRRRANLLSRSFNSLLTFYLRLSKSSLSLALFYWWSLVFAVNLFSKSLTMDSRRRANLLSRSFNSLLTFYLRLSKSSLSLALFYWWSLVFAVNLFSKSLNKVNYFSTSELCLLNDSFSFS
jgi:hypothetical protein